MQSGVHNEIAKCLVVDIGERCQRIQIISATKHIGIDIGTNVGEIGRVAPVCTSGERSRQLEQRGVGMNIRVSTLVVLCMPVLFFMAQVCWVSTRRCTLGCRFSSSAYSQTLPQAVLALRGSYLSRMALEVVVAISGGSPGALWVVLYGWRSMMQNLLRFLVAALVPCG